MIGLSYLSYVSWPKCDDIYTGRSADAVIKDSGPAVASYAFTERLRGIVTVWRIDVGEIMLFSSDIEIVSEKRCGIGAVCPVHFVYASCERFPSQMMRDFCGGGTDIVRSIPSTKLWTIEAHACRGDMEDGGHYDAGVRNAIDPFVLWQARDALDDEPIVCPTGEFHHCGEIGGGRHGVE